MRRLVKYASATKVKGVYPLSTKHFRNDTTITTLSLKHSPLIYLDKQRERINVQCRTLANCTFISTPKCTQYKFKEDTFSRMKLIFIPPETKYLCIYQKGLYLYMYTKFKIIVSSCCLDFCLPYSSYTQFSYSTVAGGNLCAFLHTAFIEFI